MNISGAITENWQISGGFSRYNKEDFDDAVNSVNLISSYTLPNEKWVVGGSVDASSTSYGSYGVTQDARTLLGIFAKINSELTLLN